MEYYQLLIMLYKAETLRHHIKLRHCIKHYLFAVVVNMGSESEFGFKSKVGVA